MCKEIEKKYNQIVIQLSVWLHMSMKHSKCHFKHLSQIHMFPKIIFVSYDRELESPSLWLI